MTAKKTALVVEDEAEVREITAMLLEVLGYAVTTATDYTSALVAYAAGRFDVVVTDLNLGPGPNGFEVAKRIRDLSPTVRIVLMSGQCGVFDDLDGEVRTAGIDVWLPKPFLVNELRVAVEGQHAPQNPVIA